VFKDVVIGAQGVDMCAQGCGDIGVLKEWIVVLKGAGICVQGCGDIGVL
jgi:hypothetical protein